MLFSWPFPSFSLPPPLPSSSSSSSSRKSLVKLLKLVIPLPQLPWLGLQGCAAHPKAYWYLHFDARQTSHNQHGPRCKWTLALLPSSHLLRSTNGSPSLLASQTKHFISFFPWSRVLLCSPMALDWLGVHFVDQAGLPDTLILCCSCTVLELQMCATPHLFDLIFFVFCIYFYCLMHDFT